MVILQVKTIEVDHSPIESTETSDRQASSRCLQKRRITLTGISIPQLSNSGKTSRSTPTINWWTAQPPFVENRVTPSLVAVAKALLARKGSAAEVPHAREKEPSDTPSAWSKTITRYENPVSRRVRFTNSDCLFLHNNQSGEEPALLYLLGRQAADVSLSCDPTTGTSSIHKFENAHTVDTV